MMIKFRRKRESRKCPTSIYGIQVEDIETGIRVLPGESFREEVRPSAVAHENRLLSIRHQLVDYVVLVYLGRGKVGTHVNERGQCASGQSLQTLQCRRRRVCDELEESGFIRLRLPQFMNDFEVVLKRCCGTFIHTGVVHTKVILQGVH